MVETDVGGEQFYTIPEVARILRVSEQSVRRWIKAGELPATKPGKEYRIGHANLEEFLRAREVRPKVREISFNDLLAEEEQHTPREQWEEAARRAGIEVVGTQWGPGAPVFAELPGGAAQYMMRTLEQVESGVLSAEEAFRALVGHVSQ